MSGRLRIIKVGTSPLIPLDVHIKHSKHPRQITCFIIIIKVHSYIVYHVNSTSISNYLDNNLHQQQLSSKSTNQSSKHKTSFDTNLDYSLYTTIEMAKYTNKLVDSRILVLGGTSGIGFAVAEAAVEYGAFVIVSSSNSKRIEASVERLQKSYPDSSSKVEGYPCDLGNTATLESNIENLLKKATNDGKDKLDHVVFTAGDFAGQLPTLSEMTVELIQRWSTTRIYGNIIMAKYLPKYINMSTNSSYTLTSGAAGAKPPPGWALLSGVCGNVESLAKGFAVDLAPLRVNCVSPGVILTELLQGFGGENLEQFKKVWSSGSLTQTVGEPGDIAESYLWCMKDKFVTGTVIECNGGLLLKS